jgi:hypothetical protein
MKIPEIVINREMIEYMKNVSQGVRNCVKNADKIDPIMPPIASSDQAHTYNSDEPFSRSLLA